MSVIDGLDGVEEDPVDDAEYYEWNELRLHPLIMKSIYRLKFKKPTPIQKACIPAAAHQGKVSFSLMSGFSITLCSGGKNGMLLTLVCWCDRM